MDVGFIGLGAMGSAMARNLIKAGYAVRGWNRSPDAAKAIEGLTVATSPAEAFEADVVFTMLPDDPSIREVILESGVLQRARPGAVHVVASTISVEFAEELTRLHKEAGVAYVSAPVLGRPDVAAKGELNILVGGEAGAVAKIEPLLEVLGQKTWPMGEEPRQANAAKIAANMMITMAIEAMAEAFALTEGNGVAQQTFFDLIANTLFGARAYQIYGQNILTRNYEPGFRMKLGLKDLRLAAAAAERIGKRLPQLDAIRNQMGAAVDAGMGERDWSAVADFTLNRA